MGFYYDQASSSASPVVVLQPQHPSQPYSMNPTNHSFPDSSYFTQTSSGSWSQSQPQTPLSAGGRKRSRDDAADNLEDDYVAQVPPPAQESEDDWEYGEGMTLIKPNGFIINASSQTGTWAEEKAEHAQQQAFFSQTPPTADRPVLRSYKSQRLDLTATPVIAEEISLANGTVVASSPPKMSDEPTVDVFTIHLGIGWSRISDAEDAQAAARGWAKFIENHYPVSGVHIRLQSKGLASYLIEANEGWFLFGEDLREGRLVSTSLERTFENLRSVQPVFDGEEMLLATVDTPVTEKSSEPEVVMNDAIQTQHILQQAVTNGTGNIQLHTSQAALDRNSNSSQPLGQGLEMEMDMS